MDTPLPSPVLKHSIPTISSPSHPEHTSLNENFYSNSPPPPPSFPDPRREKRGLLKKLETRIGIRSWATKFVIADEVKFRYFNSQHPELTEVPRKILKTSQLVSCKMPVASKYFRPHSFQVEDSFNQYVATFAAESEEEVSPTFFVRVKKTKLTKATPFHSR